MEYLTKKSFSFRQDFAFTSIIIETYTNKWKILQKKAFSFLQDCAFTSIDNKSYTNKWNILQKIRFLFRKIVHLLVLLINHILINGISCKKVDFFFGRFCIY